MQDRRYGRRLVPCGFSFQNKKMFINNWSYQDDLCQSEVNDGDNAIDVKKERQAYVA